VKIGELAARTEVSVRALRYYEEQGLLRPQRTSTGQRTYPESAVERVEFIRQLFAAGLASRTIVAILPCIDTGAISPAQHDLLSTELGKIDDHIRRLTEARNRLATVITTAPVIESRGPAVPSGLPA